MTVAGYFVCPHCGRRPNAKLQADGTVIFECCDKGGKRSFDDVTKLPTEPPDPSNSDDMPNIRP